MPSPRETSRISPAEDDLGQFRLVTRGLADAILLFPGSLDVEHSNSSHAASILLKHAMTKDALCVALDGRNRKRGSYLKRICFS